MSTGTRVLTKRCCVDVRVGHGAPTSPHLTVHLEEPRRLPVAPTTASWALARQGALALGAWVRVPLAAGGAERLVGLRAARAASQRVIVVGVTTLDAEKGGERREISVVICSKAGGPWRRRPKADYLVVLRVGGTLEVSSRGPFGREACGKHPTEVA